jgi:hypothetical protein
VPSLFEASVVVITAVPRRSARRHRVAVWSMKSV